MSSVSARELTGEEAPQPAVRKHELDPLLSSVFLAAAALILALQNPIYLELRPRPVETLVLCGLGLVLLLAANVVRNMWLLAGGSAILLLVVAAGTMSQPAQLPVPLISVWPLRVGVVLLVTAAWAFLLQPPWWVRRALLAFLIPSGLLLLYWTVPPVLYPVLGFRLQPLVNNKVPPYWLAVDRDGGVYATDLNGILVWAYDSMGQPRGTLNPTKAPPTPGPGPGLAPIAFGNEVDAIGSHIFRGTPTPVIDDPMKVPRGAITVFDFCGIAVDERDNLYLADLFDPAGYKLLRFDLDGNLTARWDIPKDQLPTNDCLSVDSDYIYLSVLERGQRGRILVYTHSGELAREINLDFLPLSVSVRDDFPLRAKGGNTLVVMGQGSVHRVDMTSDGNIITPLFTPPQEFQVPMLLTSKGEVLLTNRQTLQIGRFDPSTGKLLGTWGGSGIMPGQFGDIGSLAEDSQGRIYVSDPVNGVIDRLEPDGTVGAVMWSPRFGIPPAPVEIE
ncbi:MAG: hypothetical protein QOH93_856 [Chloroflexia bacterium]|jgi:hypothetical protein|nr:hypothetical protein [Chloroflexia bacterium]